MFVLVTEAEDGRTDNIVGPFESMKQVEEWATEHGLIDTAWRWKVESPEEYVACRG